jgi:DNA mismatch repair ATPase MutS
MPCGNLSTGNFLVTDLTLGHMTMTEVEQLKKLEKELEELKVKEGLLNTERWTLDELIAELEKWKKMASGRTCVSL